MVRKQIISGRTRLICSFHCVNSFQSLIHLSEELSSSEVILQQSAKHPSSYRVQTEEIQDLLPYYQLTVLVWDHL